MCDDVKRQIHNVDVIVKMAFQCLENIIILFLQILMSLLNLLIHGGNFVVFKNRFRQCYFFISGLLQYQVQTAEIFKSLSLTVL